MKFRYVVKIMVDAEGVEDAIKKAKKIAPQEVFIDDRVFEKRDEYALTDAEKRKYGHSD